MLVLTASRSKVYELLGNPRADALDRIGGFKGNLLKRGFTSVGGFGNSGPNLLDLRSTVSGSFFFQVWGVSPDIRAKSGSPYKAYIGATPVSLYKLYLGLKKDPYICMYKGLNKSI